MTTASEVMSEEKDIWTLRNGTIVYGTRWRMERAQGRIEWLETHIADDCATVVAKLAGKDERTTVAVRAADVAKPYNAELMRLHGVHGPNVLRNRAIHQMIDLLCPDVPRVKEP